MTQIISNNNWWGWGWASYTAWTWIDISAENEISIDTDVVQTVGNMVDNLTWADDDHYPTAKAVADAISGGWLWDVIWPASSTDWDIVLFDWVSGKLIKDSWALLSSKLDASAMSNNNYGWAWQGDSTHTPTKWVLYDKIHTMDVEIGNKAADTTVVKLTWNQTINGTKTFWTSPVVPSKTTDATNTWTAIATEAQVYNVQQDVDAIDDLIPTEATSSNKLADKNYVNDSINSVTAYYITKNAQWDQWSTYAELAAATVFYSWWVQRTPTQNDYTIVLADENHDNATTRYSYQWSQWEYQYTVNETALTQSQLDALNSWITSGKVSTYDGYASTISWKQDALVSWTNIKTINSESVLGSWDIAVQETLVSWTNIKTVNNNSLLWSWDVAINEVPAGWTEWQVLTKTNTGYEWQDWWNTPEPVIEEKIVYKMTADSSGNLYVPTWWYWGWAYNSYNWEISVNWWTWTEYSWTWSSWSYITLSWYTYWTSYTITVTPVSEEYWWARAFGWSNQQSKSNLLTEIVYDKTYKWFATSATDAWDYFRYREYFQCGWLKNAPEEYLPDTVTTIGSSFRYSQYSACSNLREAPEECMPNSVTTIWVRFRYDQYSNTWLFYAPKEVLSNNITSIPDYFRYNQYVSTNVSENAIEYLWDKVTSIWNSFRCSQYAKCFNLVKVNPEYLPNSLTTIGNDFRVRQFWYNLSITETAVESLPSSVTSIWNSFRASQYWYCENLVNVLWWKDLPTVTLWSAYRNWQFISMTGTSPVKRILVIWSHWNYNATNNIFNSGVWNIVNVFWDNSTHTNEIKNSTYFPRSSIDDSKILTLY